jgi:hypothetical protein
MISYLSQQNTQMNQELAVALDTHTPWNHEFAKTTEEYGISHKIYKISRIQNTIVFMYSIINRF